MTDLFRMRKIILELVNTGKHDEAKEKIVEYRETVQTIKKSAKRWLHNYSEVSN